MNLEEIQVKVARNTEKADTFSSDTEVVHFRKVLTLVGEAYAAGAAAERKNVKEKLVNLFPSVDNADYECGYTAALCHALASLESENQ